MDQYGGVFAKIGAAKPINNYAQRLAPGTHRIAIERFQVKKSSKDQSNIIEADFHVVSSTEHPEGETRGWAWFIDMPGWSGTYEQARAKEFIAACAACIGDQRDTTVIGAEMASPNQFMRGIVLDVLVTVQTNKDGSPKSGKNGVYTNAEWKPITQTPQNVAETRAALDQVKPLQAQQPPVYQQAQPQPQATQPAVQQFQQPQATQPAVQPNSVLGSIGKRFG
jgi:hypothetical protein